MESQHFNLTKIRASLMTFGVGRVLFIGVVLYCLLISSVVLIKAIQCIDRPFPSFLYYEFPSVGSMGNGEWPAFRAGVRYRDVILEANGQPIGSGRELRALVSRRVPGDIVHFVFQRQSNRFDVQVPITVLSVKDVLIAFGLPFVIGGAFWFLGIIVYLLKPDTSTTWVFLFTCLGVGTYMVTGFEIQAPNSFMWSCPLNMFALAFFPAGFLHLSLIFPERTALITKWRWLPIVFYCLSAILGLLYTWYFASLVLHNPTTDQILSVSSSMLRAVNWNRYYVIIGALALIINSGIRYCLTSSVIAKQRAKIIVVSSVVAFMPATLMQALISFGKLAVTFNMTAPTLLIFPVGIAYAIARHNLFDVDVFIKRTVGYVIMTIIVGTTYFSVQVILRKFVLDPMFGAQAENVYPLVFALLVVFFFNPINRKVQENVDKLFFRKQYDYKAAVAKVTNALSMTIDVNDIIHRTVGVLRKEMFLDSAGVVLLDDRKRECRSLFIMDGQVKGQEESKDLCLDYEDPLLALLAKEKKLITKYDVAEDPQYVAVRESCGQRFAAMGASVAVPLFSHDQVTGVLALGYKKSGHFYNREDIDLLKTVSSMTSTAIEQAREKGQKEIMRKLFEKHVSPEVAEAVWNQREQFLEGGRPRPQKLIATILFTDLKGFSTISEKMDPQSLMDWLNGYMDKMAKIVMDHGGVVDDYFGDAIKVNFGVPLPRATEAEIRQDAMNAVSCALAMEDEMRRLNLGMQERGLPVVMMRVGIYTGPVVAGSLGSVDRLKYTTIGDTVNTASRLESFDKDMVLPHLEKSPCRILIGESTLEYLSGEFETIPVGELSLKGKAEKIKAYCIVRRRLATVPPS